MLAFYWQIFVSVFDMDENPTSFFDIETRPDFVGDKLPSKLEVLQYLFHCTKNEKMNLYDSAVSAVEKVSNIWNNVGIPIRRSDHNLEKLKALYKELRSYQKCSAKMSKNMAEKFDVFRSGLENLFDIAHADALKQMDVARQGFLQNQRQTGRIGSILDLMEVLRGEEIYQRFIINSARNVKFQFLLIVISDEKIYWLF